MSLHNITFINDSPLPINIETWQPLFFGLSEMKSLIVHPGENIKMVSETGEWYINTFFYDKKNRDDWISAGYNHQLWEVIGKFRDESYGKNQYSWMCNDDFEIVYCKGIATFSKKVHISFSKKVHISLEKKNK
jgi:hypothetical protein